MNRKDWWMMDIKNTIFLCDMDGTLLKPNGTVSQKDKNSIAKWVEKGGYFGIATGRGHINAETFLDGVTINAPCIFYNGSMLYDEVKKEVVKVKSLPQEKTKDVLAWVVKTYPKVMVHVYGLEICHIVSKEEDADQVILKEHLPAAFSDLEDITHEPWIKILFAGKPHELKAIEEKLKLKLDGNVRWVYSLDIYLEILPKGISKGYMMSKLKELHGEDAKIVALGDYYNDVEMVKKSDYGIVMGNAPKDLQELADHVTLSNEEDGVSKALEDLMEGKLY